MGMSPESAPPSNASHWLGKRFGEGSRLTKRFIQCSRGFEAVKDARSAPLCGRFFFEKSILDCLEAPLTIDQALLVKRQRSPKAPPKPLGRAPQQTRQDTFNEQPRERH
jgi:hypothetical protein